MSSPRGKPTNMKTWISDNKGSFCPPVCNKIMYDDQLKIMFVGGPNTRKDYHIEEGEEFFYMCEGDMCLKVMEKGKPKDVLIKEGEIFVLPRRIPHSPQRSKDTVGLVIERERLPNETDGLRYYCDDNETILFEKWFHCNDLVKDLPPAIQEFMASEQCKTGKPLPGTITDSPPVTVDRKTEVMKPINMKQWIEDHKGQLYPKGEIMFHDNGEFKVIVYSGGDFEHHNKGETWLWQLVGQVEVNCAGETTLMSSTDCWIIPSDTKFSIRRSDNSTGLVIHMDPL